MTFISSSSTLATLSPFQTQTMLVTQVPTVPGTSSMKISAAGCKQKLAICFRHRLYTMCTCIHMSQVLMVLLVLAVKLSEGAYEKLRSLRSVKKRMEFGEAWRRQKLPWVEYVVSHDQSDCDLHTCFCVPVRTVFSSSDDVKQLNQWFTLTNTILVSR